MNDFIFNSSAWVALQGRRTKLPHALLLIGQAGTGKGQLAEAFAAGLLCEQPKADHRACGGCLACNWLQQGNHPDFRMLQPAAHSSAEEEGEGKKKASQQITVDQVRDLDEFINVGTHRGGLRIIVIRPAEAMNRSAANSVLKILEEPPPNTLFLLVSDNHYRLLPTIRSRCQVIPVALPTRAVAEQALATEGIDNPLRWLALSGGAPDIARQLAASGSQGWLDTLCHQLSRGGACDPLSAAQDLDKQIRDSKGALQLRQVVELAQKWLVDLTLAVHRQPARYFPGEAAILDKLAGMIPPNQLNHAYRAMVKHRRESEQPLNARLFLEALFFDYRSLFKPAQS